MAHRLSLVLFAAVAGLLAGLSLGAGNVAEAAEAICPGGASPRADVKKCMDFEVLTHCVNGQENQCWIDNGYLGAPGTGDSAYTIVSTGGAGQGNGYMTVKPLAGTAGPGTISFGPPQLNGMHSKEAAFRYYVRYREGYLSFYSGHGPQLNGGDPTGACYRDVKFQMSQYSGFTYSPGNAPNYPGDPSLALYPNVTTSPLPLRSDRWHRITIYIKLDTNGADGIIKVWLNGTLITKFANLNLGDALCGNAIYFGQFYNWDVPEIYYHYGFPPWRSRIDYDGWVLSDCSGGVCASDNEPIGPATNEVVQGPGDPSSPYGNAGTYVAFLGRHAQSDCTGNGYLGEYPFQAYRSGATMASLDNTRFHGRLADGCIVTVDTLKKTAVAPYYTLAVGSIGELMRVSDGVDLNDCQTTGGGGVTHMCMCTAAMPVDPKGCTNWVPQNGAVDNGLKIHMTSSGTGAGVALETPFNWIFPQYVTYGWIYVPSGQTTPTDLALSGFTNSLVGPNAWVALAIHNGKWAVSQRNGGGISYVDSATAVTFNGWVEYELIMWRGTQQVSLMIGNGVTRTHVLDHVALPLDVSWFGIGAQPSFIAGIIDYVGTPPFDVWFDDVTQTTASAWSCEAWGTTCPFSGGGGPTPPAPPTGLRIIP